MKKSIIIFSALCFIQSTVYASVSINSGTKITESNFFKDLENKLDDCTVTITSTLSILGSSISVSCAATATTCDLATDQAIKCVESAVNRAKKAIQ